ncbi:MAG TPA: PH domain-containing protein [Flavisolibacter sp.]|nr:PH domain-containing protein [Flavisolibacter sp.]
MALQMMAMTGIETTIHQTSPSQLINLKYFLICGLLTAGIVVLAFVLSNPIVLALLVVPVVYGWWKWVMVNSTRLTLTDQRLILSKGVFNKVTNETELYRVRDTTVEEPFFYRMFGIGNITVFTTDDAEGKVLLQAFHKPHWMKDQIRNFAEACRKNRRWGNDNVLIHDHFD